MKKILISVLILSLASCSLIQKNGDGSGGGKRNIASTESGAVIKSSDSSAISARAEVVCFSGSDHAVMDGENVKWSSVTYPYEKKEFEIKIFPFGGAFKLPEQEEKSEDLYSLVKFTSGGTDIFIDASGFRAPNEELRHIDFRIIHAINGAGKSSYMGEVFGLTFYGKSSMDDYSEGCLYSQQRSAMDVGVFDLKSGIEEFGRGKIKKDSFVCIIKKIYINNNQCTKRK